MIRRLLKVLRQPSVFLLAGMLWLAPLLMRPFGIAFFRGASYSDLLISHWPNAHFLKHALLTWRQIPLWNPMVLGGAPFAADPLSGIWYPPNWLVLVLPISLAFNLLFWLHLAWAGWGMGRLLRAEGVGKGGAIIAGLVFSGTPKMIAHIGLGHLGLVAAVSWTPWIIFVTRQTILASTGQDRDWIRWSATAGVALGLVFLADPRWIIPCVLLVVAYATRFIAHFYFMNDETSGVSVSRRKLVSSGLVASFFSFSITSGLGLSLFEFVQLSTRNGLAQSEQVSLAFPASHLLGLFLPLTNQPEWVAYLGIGSLMLAGVALLTFRPKAIFWSSVTVGAWAFSLGNQTPLYKVFTSVIPGANLLRVPPRMLFLASFGVAVLAGLGFDWILGGIHPAKYIRRVKLTSSGLVTFTVLISGGAWILGEDITVLTLGIGVLAGLSFFWLLFSFEGRISAKALTFGWILLTAGELMWVDTQILEVRSLENSLGERGALAERLLVGSEMERSFSPSYSIPQQTSAQAGLELTEGINPLQLRAFRDFMATATGFSPEGYSVTLPPFPTGDPGTPWGEEINADLIGRLNVGYIVSEYPIRAEKLTLKDGHQGVYIYRNESLMPRAWVEAQDSSGSWWPVESLIWSPNHIELQARGPGLLVLSELDYPGWRIYVDNVETEGQTVDGLLRGVELRKQNQEVEFVFQPFHVYLGGILSSLALVALVVIWTKR